MTKFKLSFCYMENIKRYLCGDLFAILLLCRQKFIFILDAKMVANPDMLSYVLGFIYPLRDIFG